MKRQTFTKYKVTVGFLCLLLAPFLIPETPVIPVLNASKQDWNQDTFWYEPWGSSGTHKGIDIFARQGTKVIAPTNLLILYKGELKTGGNIVLALGPKWRFHYFAHLETINNETSIFSVTHSTLGTVGSTGNAAGKQPHLHYSIVTLIPYPWLMDSSSQGYKKAFYLNPIEYLNKGES